MTYTVGIITASDKGARGEREDVSGKKIEEIVTAHGYEVKEYAVVADEQKELEAMMVHMCDQAQVDLILTTGGTGFAQRDRTPEATEAVCERMVPGIPEAMRLFSLQITKRAMLSRAAAGIRGNTLIINLPGSPKAVMESLVYIITELDHALGILTGKENECAR